MEAKGGDEETGEQVGEGGTQEKGLRTRESGGEMEERRAEEAGAPDRLHGMGTGRSP